MAEKTVKDYVDAIPQNMRGHVFHELGVTLGLGSTHTNDYAPPDIGDGDDSGGTRPPPPPPPSR